MERKHLNGEQMAERGWMGIREEVVEDRHSRRAEGKRKGDEKEIGKHKPNEVETSSVQVGEGTRSRRVLNRLYKSIIQCISKS